MKATREQQTQLLKLQNIDTRIAQLRAARKKHPSVMALAELTDRREDLERATVTARSHASDVQREVKRVEADLERLVTRQDAMSERLASGEGSHKDLSAIQHELNQMAQRRETLEDEILEIMGKYEAAQERVDELNHQADAVGADQRKCEDELAEAMKEVEAELSEKLAKRDEIAGGIDSDLLDEYEYCRSRTGGIGVLEANGRQIVGQVMDLPESEWHEIVMLADDEVHISEELDCIIVKTH
ncbi:MAG: hypothetical protein Q4P05_01245 [Actinomycetaceae bacterium]|nr:hypothetical protein [Actinomycetaceae bacterium]